MDGRGDPRLVAQLERARDLGFLGPGAVETHIDHAAAFVEALAEVRGLVVDLGSGGGVPGLVIGVARPDLPLLLLEARVRRCEFLTEAAAALELTVEVVHGRAELIGRSERRGTAAAVVARGFGPPAVTAECGAPLLDLGGLLVVSEPPPPARPDRWPAEALARVGLAVGQRVGRPAVQVLRQVAPCPDALPRREGLPAKRPLF